MSAASAFGRFVVEIIPAEPILSALLFEHLGRLSEGRLKRHVECPKEHVFAQGLRQGPQLGAKVVQVCANYDGVRVRGLRDRKRVYEFELILRIPLEPGGASCLDLVRTIDEEVDGRRLDAGLEGSVREEAHGDIVDASFNDRGIHDSGIATGVARKLDVQVRASRIGVGPEVYNHPTPLTYQVPGRDS